MAMGIKNLKAVLTTGYSDSNSQAPPWENNWGAGTQTDTKECIIARDF